MRKMLIIGMEALENRRFLSAQLSTVVSFGPNQYIPPAAASASGSSTIFATEDSYSNGHFRGSILEFNESTRVTSVAATFDKPDGEIPSYQLVTDNSGDVFGWGLVYTNLSPAVLTVFEIPSTTHVLTTLADLGHTDAAGDSPGALVVDSHGNVFGTTTNELFEISAASGTLSFISKISNSGQYPPQSLVCDTSGNIFGTTDAGGAYGGGTVFEIRSENRKLVTLGSFGKSDAGLPTDDLVCDASGDVYGTTKADGRYGMGTVFVIRHGAHAITTLATFDGSNGADPAVLALSASGDLYGATTASTYATTPGTAFQLDPVTGSLTMLASFSMFQDALPQSLFFDSAGNLYGTETDDEGGSGSVFEIAAGTHVISSIFQFSGADGDGPSSDLFSDAAGNLYGLVDNGGAYGDGRLYELSATGFAVAHSAPVIFSQPTNEATVAGHTVAFMATVNSHPVTSVRWQQSTDGGRTFIDLAGNPSETTQTLALFGVAASQNGTEYRAVFTNSLGELASSPATLTVTPAIKLVSPAHASPSTVASTTTTLSALAAATAGEAGLTYKWSIVRIPAGAARPTFSTNNSSAARHTVVTFHKDGRYVFRCTITDGLGDIVKSDVQVEVTQQATSLRLTPHGKTITTGQNLTFHAALYDQFGHPLRTQPTPSYSVAAGPGTVNPTTGLFSSSTIGAALIEAGENKRGQPPIFHFARESL